MDEARQVRADDPGYHGDLRMIGRILDSTGICHVTFAAECSAHKILMVDARVPRWYGKAAAGIGDPADNRYMFVALESWQTGAYWFQRLACHEPGYVRSKLSIENDVDATAVASFLNRIELARGAGWPFDYEDLERRWWLMLGRRSEREVTNPA